MQKCHVYRSILTILFLKINKILKVRFRLMEIFYFCNHICISFGTILGQTPLSFPIKRSSHTIWHFFVIAIRGCLCHFMLPHAGVFWKIPTVCLFYSSITSSRRRAHYFSFILPPCSPSLSFLFPLNTRHSADPCEQPRRRQVRTKPGEQLQSAFLSPVCTAGPVYAHANEMSTLGTAFLPSHPPPIHPLSHQGSPSHLGRVSRNTQAQNRWTSD